MKHALLALFIVAHLVACRAAVPPIGDVTPTDTASIETVDPNTLGRWITVSDNRRTFVFDDDGAPFFPLGFALHGEHIDVDYYGTVNIGGQAVTYPSDNLERYFADLAINGENLLRIDIEGIGYYDTATLQGLVDSGKQQFLETTPGVLNEAYAERVDRLFALAEQYDARLMLVLTPHTCDFEHNLPFYPYHASHGGPIDTELNDLLVKDGARELWKRRLDLIVDRWGASDRVFAWELWNEMLNCGGHDPAAAESWVAEMGQHLRDRELAKFGKSHLIAVSTVDLVPKLDFFTESPGTDFMLTHLYINEQNPVRVAKAIRAAIPANLERIDYRRPHMANERTLGMNMPLELIHNAEHFAAWAYLASGSSSAGAPWVRSGPYPEFRQKDIMMTTHKAISTVMSGLDLSAADYRLRPDLAQADNAELLAFPLLAPARGGLVWLIHDNETDHDIDLVQAWLTGQFTSARGAFPALALFLNLYASQGETVDLTELEDALVALMKKYFDLSEAEARAKLAELMQNPSAAGVMVTLVLRTHPQAAQIVAELGALMEEARTRLGSLELSRNVLRDLYHGHPLVTGVLSVSGLDPATTFTAEWVDDLTGEVLSRVPAQKAPMSLSIPSFSQHVLLRLRPE